MTSYPTREDKRCPRCRKSADECSRIGEHYPYRLCCKKCNHVPRTNQPKEKAA